MPRGRNRAWGNTVRRAKCAVRVYRECAEAGSAGHIADDEGPLTIPIQQRRPEAAPAEPLADVNTFGGIGRKR